ncbi:MAG: PQQ-binding-like beta-propeller repeat protein [Deltaproteobacteria bacterium]|nr:PQQ-binding-like beta-propeller repeat protein [Deltaproteobacteria bacterium]
MDDAGRVSLAGMGVALLCALTLSGAPDKAVRPLWRTKVDARPGPTDLVAVEGTVLAATWSGGLAALDASTGASLWRSGPPPGGNRNSDSWIAASGRTVVAAGEESAEAVARDVRSGKVLWRRDLGGRATSLESCDGFLLLAVTHRAMIGGRPTLVADGLDPEDGRLLWRTPVEGPLVGSGGGALYGEIPSGTGRLSSGVFSLRCAGGASARLPRPPLPFARFLAADEGRVLVHAFDMGRLDERLCVISPATPGSSCAPVRDPAPMGRRLARAGSFLVAGFGGKGAAGEIRLLDPRDLVVVTAIRIAASVGPAAADESRAYAATGGGEVLAVTLPVTGKARPAPTAIAPGPGGTPSEGPDATAASFRVTPRFAIDAHPRRAVTSGESTDGAVGAMAFVGPDGRLLATGGNEDRVRVHDLASQGRTTWTSPPLGKDVDGLASCSDGLVAARLSDGRMRLFTPGAGAGRAFVPALDLRHQSSWMFGLTQSCKRLVADGFDGRFHVYDATNGSLLASFPTGPGPDRRGVRVRGALLSVADELAGVAVLDMDASGTGGLEVVAWPRVPFALENEARLVQAWAVDDRTLLTEHCSASACIVSLADMSGAVGRRLAFDTRGGVWVPSVPSDIDVSSDSAYLFFYRDGIEALVVRLATGERVSLGQIPRSMSATPVGVFSPSDPRLLAVSMTPAPNKVTMFAIEE